MAILGSLRVSQIVGFTQLCGLSLFPLFCLVAAPLKMVFPKKGPLFFSRVTEQLRDGGLWMAEGGGGKEGKVTDGAPTPP